ncbi:hypothetical protein SRB5_46430 [Streptomyces sp. RB5]|uniref:CBM2 domain-containing protein n=1 Tax=Streptomyces smaragdinus TaxID=2585196 RepID=A0A7K0CLW7_9ACTN|nr:cellulose-binding domain-containing protein [Streptomyces smaragdinus]MQY14476.1 hypothetical protein [Streptomyces smaragdinus]
MRIRLHRFLPRAWVATLAVVTVTGLGIATLNPLSGDRDIPAASVAGEPEHDGADCAVGTTPAGSNTLLPDPFTRINGTRITSKSDWRCRRAEIHELAERSIYGQKPAKPTVTGSVSSTSITVNASASGKSASFSARVELPSGTGPFPAVIVFGGLGADTATIKAAGAAVINFDPYTVGREGTARNAKSGAFYTLYGSTSSTGLLMAWSWGVSRIIDVIESNGGNILSADGTGVTGCSRFGKGAITAGAFDQRIDLTMPIESGTGGVPAMRSIAQESGSQPLSSAYSEQPWLGDAFSSYTGNPGNLPVDMHEVVGLVAPRGLFIMENPHVDWLGARSGSVSALGAAEIYKALGAQSNISYWSDVADGTHCAVRNEWKTPMTQSINRFLKNSGSAPGVFRISSKKAGNLASWRNWTTPTLTDGGTTDGGTTDGGTTDGGTTDGGVTDGGSSDGGSGQDGCTATYRLVNPWNGGYQGEVTVTNTGSAAITGWRVGMTMPSGQTITSVWNGTNTGTSGAVTVRNAAWNGSLGARASTTFGFTVNGNSSNPTNFTCTVG